MYVEDFYILGKSQQEFFFFFFNCIKESKCNLVLFIFEYHIIHKIFQVHQLFSLVLASDKRTFRQLGALWLKLLAPYQPSQTPTVLPERLSQFHFAHCSGARFLSRPLLRDYPFNNKKLQNLKGKKIGHINRFKSYGKEIERNPVELYQVREGISDYCVGNKEVTTMFIWSLIQDCHRHQVPQFVNIFKGPELKFKLLEHSHV